ncbi:MAG TPA: hypothetical protein VLE95_01105 [Chlamydiales bacterium]|nr:hypothetical protein [Chlamydiales bacterium]
MTTSSIKSLNNFDRKTYNDFRANAAIRLDSSKKLVIASNCFEDNLAFFTEENWKNTEAFLEASAKTQAVMEKLQQENVALDPIQITEKKRGIFGVKTIKTAKDPFIINNTIQENINNELVVKAIQGARTINAPEPEKAAVVQPKASLTKKLVVGLTTVAAISLTAYGAYAWIPSVATNVDIAKEWLKNTNPQAHLQSVIKWAQSFFQASQNN